MDLWLQARLGQADARLAPDELEAVAQHLGRSRFSPQLRPTRVSERGWWFGRWVGVACDDALRHAIRRHREPEGFWAGRGVAPEAYLADLQEVAASPRLGLARSFRLDGQPQLLAHAPPESKGGWHLLVVYDPLEGAIRTGYSNSSRRALLEGTGGGFRWLAFRHLRF